MKDRGAWCSVVHRVSESDMTEQLHNNRQEQCRLINKAVLASGVCKVTQLHIHVLMEHMPTQYPNRMESLADSYI